MNPMNPNTFNEFAVRGQTFDQTGYDEGLRQHMLQVYNYMVGGLAVTGLVAYFAATNLGLMQLLFGTPLKFVVMLAPLAFVLVLSFGLHKLSLPTTQALFWAFSVVMGLSIASIFIVFTHTSIARVFFISAAMFGSMSLWGYTTKRDLTNFGAFLMMGLFGLVIAGFINVFLGSSGLQFVVSMGGVLIFTGLAAYDTQQIKEIYAEGWGQEGNGKLAVMGALNLYLTFINLFMSLLNLLGDRE
ncbi:Membrane protein [uncultured Gammaproteobacteria bacterium]